MPGIFGIISQKQKEEMDNHLQLMLEPMLHEKFYNSGIYSNSDFGVNIGWVCHDNSFCDCMPIWNEKKDIVLLFYGENFPDVDLFDNLKARNHHFSRHDASYIVHLYEEYGTAFLNQLNGRFSGLLFDLNLNEILLFNDRYGIQRIFYSENKNGFYFSSEAKSLLKVLPDLRQLDPRGFSELLSCQCVLENRSLFKEIYTLPNASLFKFTADRSLKKDTYFYPDIWENQPWLEKDYFFEKIKNVLRKILPRYFRSNEKIGISLTGGLDTRIIMANHNMGACKYPCYTFGGIYRDCYDVRVAQKVADICNQRHHIIRIGNHFLRNFEKNAEKTVYISDGYFGVQNSYEVYLNRLARDIAPIRITGNYGGELLRSIQGILKAEPFNSELFNADLRPYFETARHTVENLYEAADHPLTSNLFMEIPWFRNIGAVIEQSQLTLRSPYLDNDLVSLFYRCPPELKNRHDLSLRLIKDGNKNLAAIPTDRGFGGNRIFLLSRIAEIYYEFLFKTEYIYNYGMPQSFAAFDGLLKNFKLERFFLGHHKFAHFRIWYRDQLADYIKDILLDSKTLNRSYLKKRNVEKILAAHISGFRNYTIEISKLISVELLHRLLLEDL